MVTVWPVSCCWLPRCREIRDPLTYELLSTLRPTEHVYQPTCALAYSPDGHTLAGFSATSLIIWDTQTGGVIKEVECGAEGKHVATGAKVLLVWSSDGRAIATLVPVMGGTLSHTVRVYDVNSGAQLHSVTHPFAIPHLWAHNESFRIMTTEWDRQTGRQAIDISEVGSVLTKIESFSLGPQEVQIGSFSPTTYRISVSVHGQLRIFDIQSRECLLEQPGHPSFNCFSSDGTFFAIPWVDCIQIWKYGSGHYAAWGKFPTQRISASLRFSPDLSSIAGRFSDLLRVWRLDPQPVDRPDGPDPRRPLTVLSQCGTYAVTSDYGGSTVTITNLLSQSPSQFIDTGIGHIEVLALTSNVLLVAGIGDIAAWRLTEEGVVDGPPGGSRANRSDSIWIKLLFVGSTFSIRGQTVVMEWDEISIHAYHTGTGEVLDSTQIPTAPRDRQYSLSDMSDGSHYLHCRSLGAPSTHSKNDWPVSWTALAEGWVKDPEGRHRLWVPPAWRFCYTRANWHCNIRTLWLTQERETVIVMF